MIRKLQHKWKVSGWRLVVILITFAIGGSLTGYVGKKLLQAVNIASPAAYVPLYIIVVTLLWPVIVLLVSIPLGQFPFFWNYIGKLLWRIRGTTRNANDKSVQGAAAARVAIFASGAGSNAQKIIDHFRNHPRVSVALIVCNRTGAGVLQIATKENLPVLMVTRKSLEESACLEHLRRAGIDFIVLAGFLLRMPASIVNSYPRKIVNIHPALLPRYGGAGMYGNFVHEAVVASGDRESGITIHYVDEHYDTGDIIFQARCPVHPGDKAADVAQRIHALEHEHYPRVIGEILSIA